VGQAMTIGAQTYLLQEGDRMGQAMTIGAQTYLLHEGDRMARL